MKYKVFRISIKKKTSNSNYMNDSVYSRLKTSLAGSRGNQIEGFSPSFSVEPTPTPLQTSGIRLTTIVLIIIGTYIVFIIAYALISQNSPTYYKAFSNFSDTSFDHRMRWIESYKTHIDQREGFIKDMSQMVLLNLLLPTLTAILGYVFGTRADMAKDDDE